MANKGKVSVKEATTTEVALLGQSDVPTMLAQVNEQIKSLKGGSDSASLTNEDLPGFGKIENIATVDNLIKAASSVMGKNAGYVAAAKEIVPSGIKIKVPAFKIGKYTAKQWLEHIASRVILVSNKEKLSLLNEVRVTLENNLSGADKLANDLAAIQSKLHAYAEE